MITLEKAIQSLRPGAEWTLSGDDVENIVWHTENVMPITAAQIEAETARLTVEHEATVAAREAALRKMADIAGLTVDELTALGL